MIYSLCTILLLCLSAQMETTTVPANAVTGDHGSLVTTAGVSTSNTTVTDDSPPLVSGSAIDKLTAGITAAIGE